jgi:hypothetical protein
MNWRKSMPGFGHATWNVVQQNGATFQIRDFNYGGDGDFTGKATGNIVGDIVRGKATNNEVWFDIEWLPDRGSVGRYHATLGPDNQWTGNTFDRNNPVVQSLWTASEFV